MLAAHQRLKAVLDHGVKLAALKLSSSHQVMIFGQFHLRKTTSSLQSLRQPGNDDDDDSTSAFTVHVSCVKVLYFSVGCARVSDATRNSCFSASIFTE